MSPIKPIDVTPPPPPPEADDNLPLAKGDTGGIPVPVACDAFVRTTGPTLATADTQRVALPPIARKAEMLAQEEIDARLREVAARAISGKKSRDARREAAFQVLRLALKDLQQHFHPEAISAGQTPILREIDRSLHRANPKKRAGARLVELFVEFLHENAAGLGLVGIRARRSRGRAAGSRRRQQRADRAVPTPQERSDDKEAAPLRPIHEELAFAKTAPVDLRALLSRKDVRRFAANAASLLEDTAAAFQEELATCKELASELASLEQRHGDLRSRLATSAEGAGQLLKIVQEAVALKAEGSDLGERLRGAEVRLTFLLEDEHSGEPTLAQASRALEVAVTTVTERARHEMHAAWDALDACAAAAATRRPEIEALVYRLTQLSEETDRAINERCAAERPSATKGTPRGPGGRGSPASGVPPSSGTPPDTTPPPGGSAAPTTAPSSDSRIVVLERACAEDPPAWQPAPEPADLPEAGGEAMLHDTSLLEMNHAAAAAAAIRMPIVRR